MKAVGFLGILLLVACSNNARPAASVTSTPSDRVSSTVSGSRIVTPSPDESPSPSTVAVHLTAFGRSLSCSLPVVWVPPNGSVPKAGFMTFPGADLTEDRSATARAVFYDRAYRKWLPAWRTSVSPDGKRYAYGEGDVYRQTGGKLHVVDVATGADKVIYSGNKVYSVVDFAPEGIYLTGSAPEGRPHGLWLLALAGGAPRLISDTIVAPAIGVGAAWGLDFNSADLKPNPGGLEGPMNRLVHMDLRTGTSQAWFYRPGSDMYVMGFDSAGNPLVRASFEAGASGEPSAEVWLVKSASLATQLFAAGGDAPSPSEVAAIDGYGVWLSTFGPQPSVWLYAGGSIRMVGTVDSSDFHIAGGCIP